METVETMDAWEVVEQVKDVDVLQSTWVFKLKCFPDGLINKFKAHFCSREDQQIEGINFFKTYAKRRKCISENTLRFKKERQVFEAQEDYLWFIQGPSYILEVS